MSNTLAIAATTAALRHLLLTQIPALDTGLSDLEVTAQPLDAARKGVTKAQLNLFLYQTVVNAALRNMDLPRDVRPGEAGVPPLALNLHYLITAYGRGENDSDAVNHRVLGGAMSVLHDHPVLSRGELESALAGSSLGQIERVKVTPLPMGVDEMSKLWMMFQSQYRVSASYELTVLLIESRSEVRSALPVLRRGEADRGPTAVSGPAPTLREVRPERLQPAARLGENFVLAGEQLPGGDAAVRFTSARLTTAIELTPQPAGNAGELVVHLPDASEDATALSRWVPGAYTLSIVVRSPGLPVIASNTLSFALAPRIVVIAANAVAGTVSLIVDCAPRIAAEQRVLLLFGDVQGEPITRVNPVDPTQPTRLTFSIGGAEPGSYVVRLRVDGVDSIPVVYAGTPPVPSFDAAQKVTVP